MYAILLLQFFLIICAVQCQRFRVVKEWQYLNFTWPNDESLQMAMAKGFYIPEHILMAGINYYDGYYYLAIPRMRDGVPATLARISASDNKTAPLLEPYPSWEMNALGNCEGLQNVQNLEIDPKGRAWIIDGGRTATLDPVPNITCSPKLVIYDLKKNMTEMIFTFPEEIASKRYSYLYDLVVDDADGSYAYISDNGGHDPGIIVFSFKERQAWKIRHSKTMRADPLNSLFRVNGVEVAAPINIAGIALGPKMRNEDGKVVLNHDREVYYCPLSSVHLYSINGSILHDENSKNGGEYPGFVRDVGNKGSQTDGMIMDNKGVLYYGLLSTSSIVKWNSSLPFASDQIPIAKDPKYIQWPNSFTFDISGNLIALTNNLQKFIYRTMTLDEVNFRLLAANVGGQSYIYDDASLIYSTDSNETTEAPLVKNKTGPGLPQSYIDENPATVVNANKTEATVENEPNESSKEIIMTIMHSSGSKRELNTIIFTFIAIFCKLR